MNKFLLLAISLNIGGVLFSQATLVQNVAGMVITSPNSLVVNGSIYQEQNSLIKNSGRIFLTGDWRNNTATSGLDTLVNEGEVILSGLEQRIMGSSPTYFYNLTLEEEEVKSSEVNFFIKNQLNLKNSVLELNDNQVHLTNPNVNSLLWNNGYISSNNLEGYFLRSTNSIIAYPFPLGSSDLANNYRALEVYPVSNDSSVFGAKLSATDAGTETGFSAAGSQAPFDLESKTATLSELNSEYYWTVNRFSGLAEANVSFYTFKSDAENVFTSLAQWSSIDEQWKDGDFSLVASSSSKPEFNLPDLLVRSNKLLTYEDDIYVLSDVNLIFPQVFTPNGDGINDDLIIENIDLYPENSIEVFNRWGEKVFESSPYNNDWNGENNSSTIKMQGDELQEDTYFYILNLGEGQVPIKRFIELIKNQ